MSNNHRWIPEIFYEEKNDGMTQGLPFVNVPEDKVMPSSVFICGIKDLKEEDEQKELTVYHFINMSYLKDNVDLETLNKVRSALGLMLLDDAIEEGEKLNQKINNNLSFEK